MPSCNKFTIKRYTTTRTYFYSTSTINNNISIYMCMLSTFKPAGFKKETIHIYLRMITYTF